MLLGKCPSNNFSASICYECPLCGPDGTIVRVIKPLSFPAPSISLVPLGRVDCLRRAYFRVCKICCIETFRRGPMYDNVRDIGRKTDMQISNFGRNNVIFPDIRDDDCRNSALFGNEETAEDKFFEQCSGERDCFAGCRRGPYLAYRPSQL